MPGWRLGKIGFALADCWVSPGYVVPAPRLHGAGFRGMTGRGVGMTEGDAGSGHTGGPRVVDSGPGLGTGAGSAPEWWAIY